MTELLESLKTNLGESVPGILGALLVLLAGWLVALILRAVIRKGLGLARLNERLRTGAGGDLDMETGIARTAYYLILLLVFVAFFDALNLKLVSGSLQATVNQVFEFMPKLVGAGVLLLLAWVLATVARRLVTSALAATTLDERISSEAGMRPVSANLGNVLYWVIFLLFLPAVLGTLELRGLLGPVQGMVQEFLAFLPNLMAAVAIAAVGWFIAYILRDLVGNLLAAAGADSLGERVGLGKDLRLSRVAGLMVYLLVLVPALIAALQALEVQAISGPATDMLRSVMAAVPHVLAASLILLVAFFVGRLLADLTENLLQGMGADSWPERLGLSHAFAQGPAPSAFAGRLCMLAIMLFAAVEASHRLGFAQLSRLTTAAIEFGGKVLLGTAIIAVGIWISGLAHAAIDRVHGARGAGLAGVVRYSILAIIVAMGLRAMGLADDIVNLAFGLSLGAVALAAALSFGLGGREAAGRQMEHWLSRLRDQGPGGQP